MTSDRGSDRGSDRSWDGVASVGEPWRLLEVRVRSDRAVPVLLGAVLLVSLAGLSAVLLRAGAVGAVGTVGAPAPGASGWVALTDPDRVGGIASWFESALLLLAAFVLWTAADDARACGDPSAARWRLLAAGAAVVSLDELTGLHGTLVEPLARRLGDGLAGDLAWAVVAVPIVIAGGLACRGLLRAVSPVARSGLAVAAALYLGGAVGLDVVGTALDSAVGAGSSLSALASVVEEAMEMLGVTVLILVVSRYLPSRAPAEPLRSDVTGPPVPGRTEILPPLVLDLSPDAWSLPPPAASPAASPAPFAAAAAPPSSAGVPAWAIPGGAARGEVLSSGAVQETEILPVAPVPQPPAGRAGRRARRGDGEWG